MGIDIYRDFPHLSEHEVMDVDYCFRTQCIGRTLILAPHGGGIEPGTSELTEAIAAQDHSFYVFEGLKPSRNRNLHITSPNFNERTCLDMLAQADRVVAIHGEDSAAPVVFIGGLDADGIERIRASLVENCFIVKVPAKAHLIGHSPKNVCNRGRNSAGVQLEIAEGLRRTFFKALSPRSERQHTTPDFDRFVNAVREALFEDCDSRTR